MSSIEIKLLNLLKEGKSIYEINKSLGTTNGEVYKLLTSIKERYSLFDKVINNDNIQYTYFKQLYENNNTYLNMKMKHDKVRVMLVSDLHLGHYNDCINAVDLMFDYTVNNRINVVLNLGDFFEGSINGKTSKFLNYNEQINYGLHNYPSDKSVTTFLLLGNHDISLLLKENIDVKKKIITTRDDIVVTGIGRANLYLNNYYFRMEHDVNEYPVEQVTDFNNGIILKGHSHKYKVVSSGSNIVINIAHLSNVRPDNCSYPFPSMVDMTIHFSGNIIDNVCLYHYAIIGNKVVLVGEQAISCKVDESDIYRNRYEKKIML